MVQNLTQGVGNFAPQAVASLDQDGSNLMPFSCSMQITSSLLIVGCNPDWLASRNVVYGRMHGNIGDKTRL